MGSMDINGGLQMIPQIAAQIIYLDFDGELTSYNGEILSIDNVAVQDSCLAADRIHAIVTQLNAKYGEQNVVFVTERPLDEKYSTIYIGKTDAFAAYGAFAGVAETIDTLAYKTFLKSGEWELASAMGLFKTSINFVLMFFGNVLTKKITGYSMYAFDN